MSSSTVKQEAEIARRHTPDFATPVLVLEFGLFSVFLLASWLCVKGLIPLWAGMAINTAFIYSLYTVVHEAVHSNISSRRKHLRRVTGASTWLIMRTRMRMSTLTSMPGETSSGGCS
jgi:beta-carotene hydroxylase